MKTGHSIILWIIIAACAGLAFLWEAAPLSDAKQRFDTFPDAGFGYSCQRIPVSEVEETMFKGCNLLKLYCRTGRQNFFVTAIDGTHNRSAVHDARLCFLGSGWKIDKEENVAVPGGDALQISLSKGDDGRYKEVMMWFTTGEKRYGSPFNYWIDSAVRRLTLGHSGEEPVRVILQPTEDVVLDWDSIVLNFGPLWEL